MSNFFGVVHTLFGVQFWRNRLEVMDKVLWPPRFTL